MSEANSSQGAFGVSPYIDRRREFAFLVFQRNAGSGFNRFYYEIQDALTNAFPLSETPLTAKFEERAVVVSPVPNPAGEPEGVDGIRTAHRYVPTACRQPTSQCPALIAVHANASNGLAFAAESGLAGLAERERAVVGGDGSRAGPAVLGKRTAVLGHYTGFRRPPGNDATLLALGRPNNLRRHRVSIRAASICLASVRARMSRPWPPAARRIPSRASSWCSPRSSSRTGATMNCNTAYAMVLGVYQ